MKSYNVALCYECGYVLTSNRLLLAVTRIYHSIVLCLPFDWLVFFKVVRFEQSQCKLVHATIFAWIVVVFFAFLAKKKLLTLLLFSLVLTVAGDFTLDNDVIYNFFSMPKKNWFTSSASITSSSTKIHLREEENKCIHTKTARSTTKEHSLRCFKYSGHHILSVEVDSRWWSRAHAAKYHESCVSWMCAFLPACVLLSQCPCSKMWQNDGRKSVEMERKRTCRSLCLRSLQLN